MATRVVKASRGKILNVVALKETIVRAIEESKERIKKGTGKKEEKKLSPKALKIQEYINARHFGCKTEIVAELISLMIGEEIKVTKRKFESVFNIDSIAKYTLIVLKDSPLPPLLVPIDTKELDEDDEEDFPFIDYTGHDSEQYVIELILKEEKYRFANDSEINYFISCLNYHIKTGRTIDYIFNNFLIKS